MRVEKDFEDFIELLNKHKVKYLIIGAYAVSFHGRPRNTGDIDFLIEPTTKNAQKLLKVLRDFGFGTLNIQVNDILNPDIVIQLGYEPNRIDLLSSISGVFFEKAFRSKIRTKFGRQHTWFISFDDLLKSKRVSGRLKDKADVEMLMKLKKPS